MTQYLIFSLIAKTSLGQFGLYQFAKIFSYVDIRILNTNFEFRIIAILFNTIPNIHT